MNSRTTFLLALAASSAVADRLNPYLGEGCRNARLGTWEPVPVGECIDFNQAQSFILQMDEGNTYELYEGRECGTHKGDVVLSGTCLGIGQGIGSIMNVGNKNRLKIRGATWPLDKKASNKVALRDIGDAYQCPNIPSGADYFLVVEDTSAVTEEIGDGDEQTMRNDFMAQFNAMYQNPTRETEVSSYTPYGGIEIDDIQMTLDMTNGVIEDFQPRDMEAIVEDIFEFRDQQRFPANFFVAIYSGRVGGEGGILAQFRFQGE